MRKIPFFLSLGGGFLVALISIYGFFLLRQRPSIPPEVSIQSPIQIGSVRIENERDVEFILSRKIIGESFSYFFESDGRIEKREARFIPYYSQASFPLMFLIIGFFCLAIGIFVFCLKHDEVRARIFYWVSLALSSSIIIQGGFYCLQKHWLSYTPGVLFYFLYPLAPALLLHFSLLSSQSKFRLGRFVIYSPALIFAGVLETSFLYSSLKSSIEIFRLYHFIYYFFRFYIVLFVILTIMFLVIIYRRTILEEERAQIKWIFYGLFIGSGPFVFLYQLPQVMRAKPLISEEFSSVFFVLIPLALAISIVRFKLMNIELVINRSLVYSVLTVFTVSIYLFSVSILHNIFSKFFFIEETVIFMIGAFMAAVVFHPARKKIQEFVDKAFFRQSYDYRKSILSFNEKAHKMVRRDHLVDFFLLKINKTLALEYIDVFIFSTDSSEPELFIATDVKKDIGSLISYCLGSEKILARKRAVKTEENIDFSQENILERNKIEIIVPLSFRSATLAGFLTLGKKKSGERFTRDDLELLLTMTGELALNLERVSLQEEVVYERAEKEKLDELSRLKTEFISTVSHELRTPMSSIQGITEILQEQKIKDESKRDELLGLVASESSRLSRLLHNILDFGKIEQKVKTYNFQKEEIQSVIEEAVKVFRYRLESKKFAIKTHFPESPLFLEIDRDAVKQALTNLFDNAIKYSLDEREIKIQIIEKEREVEIQVKDKGIGIPPEEQEKIFEGFYRVVDAKQHSMKGVGLGLKIVKHIMTAHKGEIRVESQLNKGSTFSLIFPKP